MEKATKNNKDTNMNDVFQSLRFVFVMMIFMSHFAYRDVNPFDAGGDCGVAFFFLLSGFVMSMGYGRSITLMVHSDLVITSGL
jgi:peptidoglycan/LPS O-acetylase OafA/YrhL